MVGVPQKRMCITWAERCNRLSRRCCRMEVSCQQL